MFSVSGLNTHRETQIQMAPPNKHPKAISLVILGLCGHLFLGLCACVSCQVEDTQKWSSILLCWDGPETVQRAQGHPRPALLTFNCIFPITCRSELACSSLQGWPHSKGEQGGWFRWENTVRWAEVLSSLVFLSVPREGCTCDTTCLGSHQLGWCTVCGGRVASHCQCRSKVDWPIQLASV